MIFVVEFEDGFEVEEEKFGVVGLYFSFFIQDNDF